MATIGTLAVGSSVYMNVNGKKTEFLIVHQGLPSSLYDSSCDGTWLLMKDAYEKRAWHSSANNNYKSSTIRTYLNGTFLNLFDADIKAQIKTVKIPYVNGTGTGSVASGSSGLSTQIFLLSGYEVGWTSSTNSYFPEDGACLSYFSGTKATDSKRIAYSDGAAADWWLRSPRKSESKRVWCVESSDGSSSVRDCSYSNFIRPALILPTDLYYDPSTNEVTTAPPDPMAPKDGHNTNIGGVAFEIEGGTVLAGGVAYELGNGMMLTSGTVLEIPFGGPPVIVTISGKASSSYAYATINGTKLSSTGSWEYEAPLTIQVYVDAKGGSSANMYIMLNGTKVATGTPSRHTFETSASTVTINFTTTVKGSSTYYNATITTS